MPVAATGDAATAGTRLERAPARPARRPRLVEPLVFVASIASALVVWELVSRAGLIAERDLPSMSDTFSALWDQMHTRHFWEAVLQTVRGWALGLAVATVLAVPLGIILGSSDFLSSAFRVPIEFLRPIPSAALIPLLFLTLGTTLQSEVFLAAFGAFWPLLVQTMYGVRDVDPLTMDTARSFGVGRLERLYRIKLPSAVPYIATGDTFVAGRPRVWSERRLYNLGLTPTFDLAPDGKRVAAVLSGEAPQPAQKQVTLFLNFFDEVRRRVASSRR